MFSSQNYNLKDKIEYWKKLPKIVIKIINFRNYYQYIINRNNILQYETVIIGQPKNLFRFNCKH